MNLKDITNKLLKANFTRLFGFNNDKRYIHPAEIAQVLTGMRFEAAYQAFLSFPVKAQVGIFPYLDGFTQKKIIRQVGNDKAAYILNGLSSDDRLTFYSTLKGVELSNFIEYLNDENKDTTHDLLGYPDNSVARLINTDFATIEKEMTIAEAAEHLRKNHKDTEAANDIYVVDDEGKLIDDIPVRRLILNDPKKKIEEILDGFCATLYITDSKEKAVAMFKEYDRVVLPVVNEDKFLLGVLTVDDVLDEVEERNTKEMQKFGGLESLDYPYVKTPFFSLIKKRAGWLIVLFLSEMLTATAMSYFDIEISKAVVLALFVPLIISSGGNSGSQAATIIIRAMAVKELSIKNWWYVMRRELMSGLILGLILGSIGFLRISLWQNFHWYNYGPYWVLVAITVFFSLIGIVMWGTLSGSMIPIVLKRFNLDPATSSAPFVATLVDVTGLVIYFTIAAIMLKGTLL
ncbi:magnesium transporter [Niastella koreensis]|uniref:Magnesium transporter MgtE n=2 Tax=Niastella koreensis TaxID=354356 RepID=G8T6P7_NIAKG|nr:magnesium transporter [Niastella koreensis]AEV96892.1 magnesium transporter [Niastella koreensis GR20-10]OQP49239.1 magnesium transporter [Niastella koreensis]